MKLLVLDNYDSFTYNLVYILRELGYSQDMDVIRNDKIAIQDVAQYDKIVLSPGPGIPDSAGIMKELIREYASTKSILGVCLGHQGIAEIFGGTLYNMSPVLHGIPGEIRILKRNEPIFKDLPEFFTACHYHSWAVDPNSINEELEITAIDDENRIMGISHRNFDVKGLQFHPESILTEHGSKIIGNWVKIKS